MDYLPENLTSAIMLTIKYGGVSYRFSMQAMKLGDADPAVDLVDWRLLVLSDSLLHALLLPLL